jgi:hypothetical protein
MSSQVSAKGLVIRDQLTDFELRNGVNLYPILRGMEVLFISSHHTTAGVMFFGEYLKLFTQAPQLKKMRMF